MPDAFHALEESVTRDVTRALAEDVGTGDLTAALIPADRTSHARLMTRQSGVLCGVEWFRRTFEELDPDVEIFWHHDDGDDIVANSSLCELEGKSRAILTGDMMHNPIQLERPDDTARFDMDQVKARRTRVEFIDELANTDVFVIGSHFSDLTGGWIVRDENGCRLAQQAARKK